MGLGGDVRFSIKAGDARLDLSAQYNRKVYNDLKLYPVKKDPRKYKQLNTTCGAIINGIWLVYIMLMPRPTISLSPLPFYLVVLSFYEGTNVIYSSHRD